jgi:hypothetical protein
MRALFAAKCVTETTETLVFDSRPSLLAAGWFGSVASAFEHLSPLIRL